MRILLNGRRVAVQAHPLTRLLDVLREECGLTGTKEGCGEGECGACTVLVDDVPVNACLVPVAQVTGSRVTTIEGLRARPWPRRLAEAFVAQGGTQCGICTPGMVVALSAFTRRASLADLRVALSGNLCRCTGYLGIYRAFRAAAGARRRRPPSIGDASRRRPSPAPRPSLSRDPARARRRARR